MAYRESVQNKELKQTLNGAQYFWNIHENVGYGYKNHRSDVALVQFLLNTYNFDEQRKMITVDGEFGGNTWRAIKTFQEVVAFYCGDFDQWRSPVSDGCVSTTNGTRFTTVNKKVPYTILLLNICYLYAKSIYFHDIRRDPAILKLDPAIRKLLIEQLSGMPAVV